MTGIICINKDKDISSFGVCAKVRGITREKKCGHAGTLDPMATGVLPVLLGGATKFLDFLPDSDKGYKAQFLLGKETDTLDITGTVVNEKTVNVSSTEVIDVCKSFIGTSMQTPPMYSAISKDGKRLYELARQGIEVDREAREIEIKKLDCVQIDENIYEIDVICTKGTYIRSLIDDIGKKLGCGAVMTSLERTYACGFSLNDAITIAKLQEMKDNNLPFEDIIIPIDVVLSSYDKINVSSAQSIRFSNGGALDINRIKKELFVGKTYRVYSNENVFLGLGFVDSGELKVARVFVNK